MRLAGAAACILLALTGEAMAQPQLSAVPAVPANARSTAAQQSDADSDAPDLYTSGNPSRFQTDSAGSTSREISVGPLRFKIDSTEIARPTLVGTAKRAQAAHVQLEDVHLLGGNISGGFDGRAATLKLSWPTSN